MKKPNDDQSEDKASRRLEQFKEAREPSKDPCEEEENENSATPSKKAVKNSPKPPETNGNPRRKKN